MADIVVRQATLADTFAITDIHCSNVEGGVFTRRNSDGTRTPVPYEELSLFERYLSGGPWMSVEMCAVWLAHLLRHGDEIPLVAEADGLVLGEAEVTIGNEPPPYGRHLSIATLKVHQQADEALQLELEHALMHYIKEMARVMRVQHILAPHPMPHDLYQQHKFQALIVRRQAVVTAKEGRVVYKALPMSDFGPEQIDGWYMPFGRFQSARHEWAHIWPGFWNGVPELVEPETSRFIIELSGQRGIYFLRQDRYQGNRADAYLWTERPLSSHMVSAARDRAARQGYDALVFHTDDKTLALMETEVKEVFGVHILLAWRVEG